MKDDFPEIYKNKIDNIKFKVQNEYYIKKDDISNFETNTVSLTDKINNIFNSIDFVYKKDVLISLKDGTIREESLIGRNENNLITINNEYIPISSIKDIK